MNQELTKRKLIGIEVFQADRELSSTCIILIVIYRWFYYCAPFTRWAQFYMTANLIAGAQKSENTTSSPEVYSLVKLSPCTQHQHSNQYNKSAITPN